MKWWSIITFCILIASTISLAYVSAQLTIGGTSTNKVIELSPSTNATTSSSGGSGGANVSSVSSGNAYIVIPTPTGNVVVSLNTALLNTTIDQMINTSGFKIFWLNDTHQIQYHNKTIEGQTRFNATAGNTAVSISGVPSGGTMDKYLRFYSGATPTFWIGDAVFNGYSGIVQEKTDKPFFFGISDDGLSNIHQFILFAPTGTLYNSMTALPHEFRFNNTNSILKIRDQQIDFHKDINSEQYINWSANGTTVFHQNITILGNLTATDSLISPRLRNATASTDLALPFNGTGIADNRSISLLIPHQSFDITSLIAFNNPQNNTLDRAISVTVSVISTTGGVGDTAVARLNTAFSNSTFVQSRSVPFCIETLSTVLSLRLDCTATITVQSGELWVVNGTTGGAGVLAINNVRKTIL